MKNISHRYTNSAEAKAPRRRFLLLAFLLALFSGFQLSHAPAFAQSEEEEEETEEQEEGEDGEEKKKVVGKHIFIKLEPLISPVLDDRSIRGKITLRLRLHLLKPELEEKVRQRVPKLNDAYLNYMYRYGSSAASSGIMQLDSVMGTFQRLTNKIMGKNVVTVMIDEVSRTRSK